MSQVELSALRGLVYDQAWSEVARLIAEAGELDEVCLSYLGEHVAEPLVERLEGGQPLDPPREKILGVVWDHHDRLEQAVLNHQLPESCRSSAARVISYRRLRGAAGVGMSDPHDDLDDLFGPSSDDGYYGQRTKVALRPREDGGAPSTLLSLAGDSLTLAYREDDHATVVSLSGAVLNLSAFDVDMQSLSFQLLDEGGKLVDVGVHHTGQRFRRSQEVVGEMSMATRVFRQATRCRVVALLGYEWKARYGTLALEPLEEVVEGPHRDRRAGEMTRATPQVGLPEMDLQLDVYDSWSWEPSIEVLVTSRVLVPLEQFEIVLAFRDDAGQLIHKDSHYSDLPRPGLSEVSRVYVGVEPARVPDVAAIELGVRGHTRCRELLGEFDLVVDA